MGIKHTAVKAENQKLYPQEWNAEHSVELPMLQDPSLSYPILRPLDDQGEGFSKGVGTPNVVVHPDNGQAYLVFTGWSNPSTNIEREVFVGKIDEGFHVSDISKIIPYNAISGIEGHETAHVVYDPWNEKWIIATLGWKTGVDNKICLFRFSKDFSTKTEQYETALVSNKDPGMPIRRLQHSDTGKKAIAALFDDLNLKLYEIADLSVALSSMNFTLRGTLYTRLSFDEIPDVFSMDHVGNFLLFFIEVYDHRYTSWRIRPYWLPFDALQTLEAGTFTPLPMFAYGDVINEPLIGTTAYSHGHPHLTRFYGKLWLLHARFTRCGPDFRHEIWAQPFDPAKLYPSAYPTLIGHDRQFSIGASATKKYLVELQDHIPKFMKIKVQISQAGSLTVKYNDIYAEGDETTEALAASTWKIVTKQYPGRTNQIEITNNGGVSATGYLVVTAHYI